MYLERAGGQAQDPDITVWEWEAVVKAEYRRKANA
jgi:hypothetical protein